MKSSIAFFDTRISDYQTLIEGLAPEIAGYLINEQSNGLEQILSQLQGRKDIAATHIFSHESHGILYVGNWVIDINCLDIYHDQLNELGDSLTETGELLIYGCNVAQGEAGLIFMASLAKMTGRSVAASIDLKGDTALGGNWVLEAATGPIDAPQPLFAQEPVQYAYSLDVSGALDTTFDHDGRLTTTLQVDGNFFTYNDAAYGVAIQPDGKIVAVGMSGYDFAVVRYNSNGSLDNTFSSDGMVNTNVGIGLNEKAYDVAIQNDGKIILVGTAFGNWDPDFALVRYNENGSLDTTFSADGKLTTAFTGVDDSASSVVIQPDGMIVVAGTSSGGDYAFALARYNQNGSLDTSFSGDGLEITSIGPSYDFANTLALQPDGKIVVAGASWNGGDYDFALARYNQNGTLDTSFSGDGKLTTALGAGYDAVRGIAVQSDGNIVVAGVSWNGFSSDVALARYNPDGSLDTTFDGDGKLITRDFAEANEIAVQPDGRIVVAGSIWNGTNYDFGLARYNPNGSLDTTFDGDGKLIVSIGSGDDKAYGLALQSDGNILVAGSAWTGRSDDIALIRVLGGNTSPPAQAALSITAASADMPEGDSGTTPFTFTVTRSGDTSNSTSVQWTLGANASPAANLADFSGTNTGTLTWGVNDASTRTITVNVLGDRDYESGGLGELFTIDLSNATSASVGLATATGHIQNDDALHTAMTIFRSEGGTVETGRVRVMADFAKAAYALQYWENRVINDESPNASDAYVDVTRQGWVPLNLTLSPTLDQSSTVDGQTVTNSVVMSNGFYTNGNAAAFVAHSSDSLVISFRGTNDNGDTNPSDSRNSINPDKSDWTSMRDHYTLLEPLIKAIDKYALENGISNIYVTGHSLGGAMAIQYMGMHSGTNYSSVTFAAPGFQDLRGGAAYDDRIRVTHIEINGDLTPDLGAHGGRTIHFVGDDDSWWISSAENHSMDYYRQITKSVDSMAWTEILNQNGDPEVFLGASSNSDGTVFIVDGLVGGSNAAVNNGNDTLTDPALADYDVFYGGRGSDILTGGSANEVFIGGAGNDRLIGGDGIDSAAFGGTRASYMLVKLGPDWQVTNIGGGEGQDTLRGIERLTFDDRLLALDLAGNAGLVVKTLGAVFGPASAHFATYVGIGLKLVDGGMSYTDLMQLALEVQLGTGASNAAVVTLLYTNLAGVPPGAGDLAAFTALLDNQTYSQPGLGVFAGDHALNLANIDLVGLTQTGLDFE